MEHRRLRELADTYLRASEGRLRPRSLETIRRSLDLLLTSFGDWEPDDVGSYHIEAFMAYRAQQVAPATAHRDLRCIRAFYNALIRWDLASSNPVKGVPFPRLPRNIPRILSTEEVHEEVRKARAASPVLHGMVLTALYAGLRRAEIVHLAWQDIDGDMIFVRNKPEHPLKDYEERTIPLHDRLAKALRIHHFPGSRCFRSPRGYFWERSNLSRTCRQYGLRGFHILRHTFATNCLRSGVDIRTVQEWLGHAHVETTMRYLHVSPEGQQELINLLRY